MSKFSYLQTSKPMDKETLKNRFIGIYDVQSDAIFRYCFFRISDREVATDLTQETFTKLWDYLASGKEINNDRAFIFMIARNLIIDYYRKKKSLSLDAILEEDEDKMFMSDENKTKEDADMSVEARFVMDKISLLPANAQQIIYLRFVEGLNPKEIGDVLGVTSNAVSVRVIRALDKLRELTGYNIEDK